MSFLLLLGLFLFGTPTTPAAPANATVSGGVCYLVNGVIYCPTARVKPAGDNCYLLNGVIYCPPTQG